MAGTDDLLSADEIEALIQAAQTGEPDSPGPSKPAPAAKPPAKGDLLDPSEIEAMMQASSAPPMPSGGGDLLDASEIDALMQGNAPPRPAAPRPASPSPAESTLQRAESQLAAAMAPQGPRGIPPELGSPAPFSYPELGAAGQRPVEPFPLMALQDVELDLRIELGRTELLIEEVLKLREGSVVPLDKLAGDPVDILVNGRLVARGEVLVLNDNFCVRVAEILTPEG